MLPHIFVPNDFDKVAREELKHSLELLGIKSARDVGKASRLQRRDLLLAFPFRFHGIEEIERFELPLALHVPLRKSAIDWIAEQDYQLHAFAIIPDPFHHGTPIQVDRR